MNRNEIPQVTPEIQAAWDVIADYLNKHPKLSFHISPWSASILSNDKRYTLEYMDGSEPVGIVTASQPHTREKR